MSSPVELPSALLARRRKMVEKFGPGPDEEGETTTPPADEPPADPPKTETPPKREDPPAPAEPPAQPPADDGDDGDDDDDDLGPIDLLNDLGDLLGEEKPPKPPAEDTAARDRAEIEREKQRLKEEREALEIERREMEQQRKQATQPEAPALKAAQLTADQTKNYEKSREVIQNFAVEAVAEQVNPILKEISARLAALEEGHQTVAQKTQKVEDAARTMTDHTFNKTVVDSVGDIRPLLKNDRFKRFLSRAPQYMPDKTLRELFTAAMEARNPTPIVSIVKAFAKSEAAAGRPLDNMRAGSSTGGLEKPLQNKRGAGKMLWSERQKAWDNYRLGVISKTEFDEVKARFEEADSKGLVDYGS